MVRLEQSPSFDARSCVISRSEARLTSFSADFSYPKISGPRLLAGFRAIDKLYGSSPQRLNEGCLISFFVADNKTPAELMKRIGNAYDLDVWKDESVFNLFRQEALMRSGELPRHRKTGSSPR